MASLVRRLLVPAPRPVRWVAVAAWCLLIFGFSAQPHLRIVEGDLDFILRKCAHAVVFGVLSLLAYAALRGEGIDTTRARGLAWLGAVVYAISDEFHQSLVPGRHAAARDVMIDATGALLALLVHRHLTRPSRKAPS